MMTVNHLIWFANFIETLFTLLRPQHWQQPEPESRRATRPVADRGANTDDPGPAARLPDPLLFSEHTGQI